MGAPCALYGILQILLAGAPRWSPVPQNGPARKAPGRLIPS